MKSILLIALVLFSTNGFAAANCAKFTFSAGKAPMELCDHPSYEVLTIQPRSSSREPLQGILASLGLTEKSNYNRTTTNRFYGFEVYILEKAKLDPVRKDLAQIKAVRISPALVPGGSPNANAWLAPTGLLLFSVPNTVTLAQLKSVADKYGLETELRHLRTDSSALSFYRKTVSGLSDMELAEKLATEKDFMYAEPNFLMVQERGGFGPGL